MSSLFSVFEKKKTRKQEIVNRWNQNFKEWRYYQKKFSPAEAERVACEDGVLPLYFSSYAMCARCEEVPYKPGNEYGMLMFCPWCKSEVMKLVSYRDIRLEFQAMKYRSLCDNDDAVGSYARNSRDVYEDALMQRMAPYLAFKTRLFELCDYGTEHKLFEDEKRKRVRVNEELF